MLPAPPHRICTFRLGSRRQAGSKRLRPHLRHGIAAEFPARWIGKSNCIEAEGNRTARIRAEPRRPELSPVARRRSSSTLCNGLSLVSLTYRAWKASLPGAVRIKAMHLVKINVIRLQAPQASFDSPQEVLTRKPFAVRSRTSGKEDLGGQNHIVAPALQTFTQNSLRVAVGVAVSRINEVTPALEVGIEDGQRRLLITARSAAHARQASKRHGAQTKF